MGPKKACKNSNILLLPWAAKKSKLIWALLTEVKKTENFKVLIGKWTKGEAAEQCVTEMCLQL
jgi:hypothetical protein